ncbi:MAG TPA: hypothetical protein VLX61_09165 [Anaerolineales bacterium]|nr:hypothetical protein [Anaerolineales bacterium]
MNLKPILQSQYLSALAMLKQAVFNCPPETWDDAQDKAKFWFVAYHRPRYAHQYLKAKDQDYPRWEQRRHSKPGVPFSKKQILERLAAVEQDVAEQIPIMNLNEKTGAAGNLANRLELQIYNIRHIQQPTGELYQRLSLYPVKLGWASQRYHFARSRAQSGPWRRDTASPKEKE